MIALFDREDVKPIRQEALDSWFGQNVNISLFDAITPSDLQDLDRLEFNLKAYGDRDHVPFSDTEKSIWYSHFFLWEHCIKINKPICIIEEDCRLNKRWPRIFEVETVHAFCKASINRSSLTPAAGYILTVDGAQHLIDTAQLRPLTYNIDHLLIKNVDDKKATRLAYQIDREFSTIEHW